jgi:MoaA/NifB/PqqE/SkfB family radical SAM enzyme
LHCATCDIPLNVNKKNEMKLKFVKKLIDDGADLKFNKLLITGGNSFNYKL